jgi:hypothetical protein
MELPYYSLLNCAGAIKVDTFIIQSLIFDIIEVLMSSLSFQGGFVIFKIPLFICGCDYNIKNIVVMIVDLNHSHQNTTALFSS